MKLLKPWFWAEWTPVGMRRHGWHFRVWYQPERYRTLNVVFGLHWIVQLFAFIVHKWQKASGEPSFLERKIRDE